MADEDVLRGLQTKITDNSIKVRRNDAYYDGEKRLAALGLALPPEMRKLQVVVNWPRLVVDSLEERIDLQGFRMGGSDEPDDRLWGWWQANNLDEESGLGHLEAFVQGRSFVVGGFDDDRPETPLITCESAKNMAVDFDHRTRKVESAVRLYDFDPAGEARSATLYLPGRNLYYGHHRGRWLLDETIETGLDRVPVVPMVNKARLADRGGRSEMVDVIDMTDAACRALTDLQGAQELVAIPARFVFGVSESDMRDQNGNPVPIWEAYIGRLNMLGNEKARVEQLAGADLRNFEVVVDLYARQVSAMSGMPPHYLGLTSENPASADAIRSAEARHVKRAERKCKMFGGVWEEVMRLGMEIVDGNVPEDALRMEALFADPATPTYAAKVDGVTKLHTAGLIPREAAWEELGWSPEKRRRYAELMENDATEQLIRSLGVGTDPSTSAGATATNGDSGLTGRQVTAPQPPDAA